MHRVGGIEKQDGTGNISYDPDNHFTMVKLRAAKVAGIAKDIPQLEVVGDTEADLLVLGWGSTWGAITDSCRLFREGGGKIAHAHLMHLNPFPSNLGEVLKRYRRVIVPELNMGQLCQIVRGQFLVDARPINKVAGVPFTSAELVTAFEEALRD